MLKIIVTFVHGVNALIVIMKATEVEISIKLTAEQLEHVTKEVIKDALENGGESMDILHITNLTLNILYIPSDLLCVLVSHTPHFLSHNHTNKSERECE